MCTCALCIPRRPPEPCSVCGLRLSGPHTEHTWARVSRLIFGGAS